MQVRCQRCGWSLNLGRDFMTAAVEEAEEKQLKYIQVECSKCRHSVKVPVKQVKRFIPKPTETE